jgi:hypothetical protein
MCFVQQILIAQINKLSLQIITDRAQLNCRQTAPENICWIFVAMNTTRAPYWML